VLFQFDDRLGMARRRYRAFIRAGTDEGYREEFHSGAEDPRVLGDKGLLASVLKEKSRPMRRPSLTEIIQAVGAEYGLAHDELPAPIQSRLASEATAVVGWLAGELGSASLWRWDERRRARSQPSALYCADLRSEPGVTPS